MCFRKTALFFCLALTATFLLAVQSMAAVQLRVLAQDPESSTTLELGSRLSLHLGYSSDQPLRFRLEALHQNNLHEVGAITNPATLQPSGEGETLVWISFSNATHIDTVRVTALDAQWNRLESTTVATDISWREGTGSLPRTPEAWIGALEKTERREQDYTYDPLPKPTEPLWDLFFLFSVAALPVYLLLQFLMLRRYQTRWRELAAVPLVALVPLIFFSLIGFGMDLGLWASFLFRCTPFALAYLLVLWVVKRFRPGISSGR